MSDEVTENDIPPIVHSVVGGWLGTYYYRDRRGTPCRFEATLTFEGMGRFGGSILDDSYLGEATVLNGVQTGEQVHFTKVYQQSNGGHGVVPVHYEGILAGDGKTMRGTWTLTERIGGKRRRITATGDWEARRLWSEENTAEDIPEVMAIGAVRPLVAV